MPSPNLIRLSQLPVAVALTGLERLPMLHYGEAMSARVEQILGDPDRGALDLDTPFYEPPAGGPIALRADRTVHLVSAAGGAVEAHLPLAREVPRRVMVVKKRDASANPIIITATEQTVTLAPRPAAAGSKVARDGVGAEPAPIALLDPPAPPPPDPTIGLLDGAPQALANPHDFVMAISDGADWHIIAGGWQAALAAQTLPADLDGIAQSEGYGILEKRSPSDGDWGFRGLGTADPEHLLRATDGDGRYVQAAAIASVALTGNYDDLVNAINKGVISSMEQRITTLENAVFGP